MPTGAMQHPGSVYQSIPKGLECLCPGSSKRRRKLKGNIYGQIPLGEAYTTGMSTFQLSKVQLKYGVQF